MEATNRNIAKSLIALVPLVPYCLFLLPVPLRRLHGRMTGSVSRLRYRGRLRCRAWPFQVANEQPVTGKEAGGGDVDVARPGGVPDTLPWVIKRIVPFVRYPGKTQLRPPGGDTPASPYRWGGATPIRQTESPHS